MRDQNEGVFRAEEGKTPVTTAFEQKVAEGNTRVRVELESASDDKNQNNIKYNHHLRNLISPNHHSMAKSSLPILIGVNSSGTRSSEMVRPRSANLIVTRIGNENHSPELFTGHGPTRESDQKLFELLLIGSDRSGQMSCNSKWYEPHVVTLT